VAIFIPTSRVVAAFAIFAEAISFTDVIIDKFFKIMASVDKVSLQALMAL
jgi:hypothetical protein